MVVLRTGGTALDAIEIAIKVLEDREITNAGYGSNLAVDGIVECDATIVDHFGRSGAVGAVSRTSFQCYTTFQHRTDIVQKSKIQSPWLAHSWTAAHSYSLYVESLQICWLVRVPLSLLPVWTCQSYLMMPWSLLLRKNAG